jgi:activator of HSP90 ATPase
MSQIHQALETNVNGQNVTAEDTPMLWPIADACSRRRMIVGSILGLGSSATVRAHAIASEAPNNPAIVKTIVAAKAIHQEEDFQASPHRIYEVLLDAKQFSAFSGDRPAKIDRSVGGPFSLFAGHIAGRNLELVPDRRVVQAWRAVAWPAGVYSIAKFELQGRDSGTHLVFDHTGFPPDLAEHLEGGWQENYWQPLRKYLG